MLEKKEDNNTLCGFHIRSKLGDPLKVYPKKYTWHIPKNMRSLHIQQGDIIRVKKTGGLVLVTEVFRENIEDTGKIYRSILALHERAPVKEE
jgi:formylmethanofuran dehydrogenase subunit D